MIIIKIDVVINKIDTALNSFIKKVSRLSCGFVFIIYVNLVREKKIKNSIFIYLNIYICEKLYMFKRLPESIIILANMQ